MSYDNTNSGVLFKNDRKEKDTHPDYKGSINVDGVEYWLSSWIKEGQKGKFMSLSIQPKQQAAAAPAPRPAPAPAPKPAPRQAGGSGFDDLDSEIPF